VHELTAIAHCAPVYSRIIASNFATLGPVPIHPPLNVAITSSISSSPISGLPNTKKLSRTLFFFWVNFDRTGVVALIPNSSELDSHHRKLDLPETVFFSRGRNIKDFVSFTI